MCTNIDENQRGFIDWISE